MLTYMKQGKGFYRNLVQLALPMVLQNLVTTTVGLVDTFMVGALGEAPLAAVTVANLPVFVVQLLVFGLMSGSSVLISQYWGKGETEDISRVIGVGWYIAGGVSLLFALVMLFFPMQLMGLLSNEAELVEIAAEYARPIGISYIFTSLAGIYTGAQRSMENPKLGLLVSSVSVVVNIFFNWVFIFGNLGAPAWGVFGAAFATLIARFCEFLVTVLYIVFNKRFRIKLSLVFRPGLQLFERYVKYATPVVLNETLWGLGFSMYQVVLGHMQNSTALLAAYTVSGNLEKLFAVFMFGVGNAAAIIIGREIGAGRADTVHDKGKALGFVSFLLGIVLAVGILLATKLVFEPIVYPFFSLSPLASEFASLMLTVIAIHMPVRAFNNTNIVGVLRGGGDVRMSMLIDVIPLWCLAVPLAFLFGIVLELSIVWVYGVQIIENVVKFFLGTRRLSSGMWVHDVTQQTV